jgi:hypothetical protein
VATGPLVTYAAGMAALWLAGSLASARPPR